MKIGQNFKCDGKKNIKFAAETFTQLILLKRVTWKCSISNSTHTVLGMWRLRTEIHLPLRNCSTASNETNFAKFPSAL